jgi:hypothetical protein
VGLELALSGWSDSLAGLGAGVDTFKFFSLWSVIVGLIGAVGIVALLWPMEAPMAVTFAAAGFLVAGGICEIALRLMCKKPAS